ncbi:hypothetical protein BGZ80_006099 [Entomortierella chlamydospora]|uniref:F-box domain protein n=1 Tax=Entomortierella chlamydospora TaxID=101097 RepID=A0A9P6N5U8_9FUNG|nr:hypothetical protein BGZ80_006099 [Entomortierella chlamydospora]
MSLLEPLGASLTSLHIRNLPESAVFPWRMIFRTCPQLLHLHLQGLSWYHPPQLEDLQNGIVSDIESDGTNDTSANADTHDLKLSLRTCALRGFSLTKDAFYPFARACPKLQALQLIDINTSRGTVTQPETGMLAIHEEQVAFLHKLPEFFPMLRSLHLTTNHGLPKIQWDEIPSQFLRNIGSWGLGVEEILDSTSSLLKQFSVEGFLTSLELIGVTHRLAVRDQSDEFMPFGPNATVGDLLHTFLCQAPNLLHLKAEGVNVELNLLDPFTPSSVNAPYIVNNVFLDGTSLEGYRRTHPIWACRNLRTLHLRFDKRAQNDDKTDENSRKLFGYISRVCPRLEDLLIHRTELTLRAMSGFCLLSNLARLKRLKIITKDATESLRDVDIDWMQNEHYNNEGLSAVQSEGYTCLTELTVETLIKHEKLRVGDAERKFKELLALHKQYGVPVNSDDIPESLRGVPFDDIESGAYTKKSSSIGFFSGLRDKLFGSGTSPGNPGYDYSFGVNGVDMEHWGEDSDLIEYFKKRRAQRDVPIWSEMERLEIEDGSHLFTHQGHHRVIGTNDDVL